MQTIGFQKAVEKILAVDSRYHGEAYVFLKNALESTLKRRKKNKKDASQHVNAEELLEGFRLHALQEYGPMTVTVFEYWGVRSCEDVGNLVFLLVQEGVFGKTEDDTIESFRSGYDFHEAFVTPFQPEPKNLSVIEPGIVGRKA